MKERLHKVLALFLMGALLTVTLGLAVPNINVSVQELGRGGCDLKSPVQWANVHLVWATRRNTMTLEAIEVYFSDDLPRGTEIRLLLRNTGYHSFWDNTPSTDLISNVTTLPADLNSGEVISLTPNGTYSYWVFPLFGFPVPSVENVTIVLVGGQSICPGGIVLSVQNIGVGSTSYSPPPVSLTQINVTVNNLGGPELKDYVLNFTVSSSCIPDLSKVYVTDSSGNPLYFWAFNDSENGKIWFWVNYTVPANSVNNVTIHLNGTGTSPYFDPNKVFWYFTNESITLEGSFLSSDTYSIPYNVYNILNSGYSGYTVDTYASFGHAGMSLPFLGPYWVALTNGNYYGLGITDDGGVYIVSGPEASQVSLGGDPLGEIPSWGPGLCSISLQSIKRRIFTEMSYEGMPFVSYTFKGAFRLGFTPRFILGQGGMFGLGNESVFDWIGFRPLGRFSPEITVLSSCSTSSGGGDYTFTLYFRP